MNAREISNLPFEVRFKASYTINKTNGCWELNKPKKNGYGQIVMFGVRTSSHIASWEFHNGLVPDNLCVLHRCDNRRCVNPKHLYLGTKKQNHNDFVERHPKAKELFSAFQLLAKQGAKNFWQSMSKEERAKFCKKKATQ